MKQLIQQFLEELEIRNYSQRTILDCGYHLDLWQKFFERKRLHEVSRVTDSTMADFQRWLFYLPTRHGAARGVLNQNTVLAALKSFFRFLKTEGIISRDPAASLPYARQPSSLPRNVLTPEEANRILDQVDISTPLGRRDRAILEVLFATGIRKEELHGLVLSDLNLEEGLIRIRLGKGGRDRVVPLGTKAVRALDDYLKQG